MQNCSQHAFYSLLGEAASVWPTIGRLSCVFSALPTASAFMPPLPSQEVFDRRRSFVRSDLRLLYVDDSTDDRPGSASLSRTHARAPLRLTS
eukprot:6194937-Pleurochrysis_carterae.AAC.3